MEDSAMATATIFTSVVGLDEGTALASVERLEKRLDQYDSEPRTTAAQYDDRGMALTPPPPYARFAADNWMTG
jgi:hypothetical protein